MDTPKTDILLGIDLSKRKFGLDILRALGIFFVLLYHTEFNFLPNFLYKFIQYITIDGVSLFFVLSGYLIGSILVKSIDRNGFNINELFHFWINRWLRTIPPYYFVLVLLLILSRTFYLAVQSYFLSFVQKLSYFVFLQNFIRPHYGFFAESWSLAVEEWFYLITPITLLIFYIILRKNKQKSFIFTIILIISFSISYRLYNYYFVFSGNITDYYYNSYFHTIVLARLDAIMFGVLGAYIHYYHVEFWNKILKIGLFVGFLIICIDQYIHILYKSNIISFKGWLSTYICCYSYSIFSLGILLLLPFLTNLNTNRKGFYYKIIMYTSLISYSLYLLHFSLVKSCIMPYLDDLLNLGDYSHFFLYWTISILLSLLMFKYIEKPSMNLRQKIFKIKK